MIRIEEDNLQVRFLNDGLVYIILYKGSRLSYQLMREINVLAKVNRGQSPTGYIINVNDHLSSGLFNEVYKKAGRMELPVALITQKPLTTLLRVSTGSGATHVFSTFRKAISWIKTATVEVAAEHELIRVRSFQGAAKVYPVSNPSLMRAV